MSSTHQFPSLPVLPINKRRRVAAAARVQGLAIQQAAPILHPRTRNHTVAVYRHAGVVALCLSAVALVGALVTFSILRDLSALTRPVEPVITAPLRP